MDEEIYNDPNHPLLIGYYDPFSAFPLIQKELQARFPLTNLHWKYDISKPLKSIPLLPMRFVEEVPRKQKSTSKLTNIDAIYLRMMLVTCDTVDAYRSQVRPLIKEWLNNIVSARDSEWMLILVIPTNAKDKHSSIIKLSILDKLKIDFGIDGKELAQYNFIKSGHRIFKVKEVFEDDKTKLEIYSNIINHIKELILSKFTVKFSELQRKISNKSNDIFDNVLTELNLAELFNDMRLYEDSLRYYKLLGNSIDKIITTDTKLSEFEDVKSIIPSNLDNYILENSTKIQTVRANLIKRDSLSISLLELKSFLFVKQASLLQSLASHSGILSISASYIASFYQKLLIFLNDITMKIVNSPKVVQIKMYQWSYTLIDTYLNSNITRYIFKKSNDSILNNNETTLNQVHPLHEILECMGELKLFQRTLLVNLGKLTKNYILHGASILEEIDLIEENKEELKFDQVIKLTYSPLVSALESENNFLESYQKITESTIQDFAAANREKSIDILSIDIALVKYYQKKYTEALQILEDSSEFFITNGWNFMGGLLLEAYLSCIENLLPDDTSDDSQESRNRLISTSCLKLLSNLRAGKLVASSGINNYKLIKSTDSVSKLFTKAHQYSKLLKESLIEFDIDEIFCVSICPHIQSNPDQIDSDSYFIDIEVLNAFEVEINIENIVLELRNDSREAIIFLANDCVIYSTPKLTIIRLSTNSSILGIFRISKLFFSMNDNLKFLKSFTIPVKESGEELDTILGAEHAHIDYEENDESVIYSSNSRNDFSTSKELGKKNGTASTLPLDSSFQVISFPRFENLWFEFINPANIELGKTDIILRIHGGNSNSYNIEVDISSLTPGVVIKDEEISIIGSDESNKFKSSCVPIEQLILNTFVDVRIPYVYFSDSNKYIKMKATVAYQIGLEQFSYTASNGVDTTLTISVSVQDIFKMEHIFSKFQVGTSNSKYPIRVISHKLTSPKKTGYKVDAPTRDPGPIVAFGEQPASYFYKLYPTSNLHPEMGGEEYLDLVIQYCNLQDEVQHIFETTLLRKIRSVSLGSYWFLFKNILCDKVVFNINQYALSGEIQIQNGGYVFNLINRLLVRYIPREEERLILRRLFEQLLVHPTALKIETDDNTLPKIEFKTLSIQVPIPHLSILHIVEFVYENISQLVVGESLKTKLKIQVSKKWSALTNKLENGDSFNRNCELFLVNVITDDNWLISGFKKTTFEVDYSQDTSTEIELDLVLIPLNVGKLLLPKLDIRLLNSGLPMDEISMDTVFKNGLETILVVPELDSITFSF